MSELDKSPAITMLESFFPPVGHADKIQTLEQAVETRRRWKEEGLKVGFTNGCYDLLHPGHVFSIGQTRSYCDKLIVGLNSDASVKRQGKGEDRPIYNQEARGILLSSLQDVDLVVLFEEDTPKIIIDALVPDILLKGKDYEGKLVVGRETVEASGGKVILADLMPNFSTTSTIKKLNKGM